MKRRILSLLTALALCLSLLPATALADEPTGNWTDVVTSQPSGYTVDGSDNVTISSAEGLAWLAVLVNGLNDQTATDFSGVTITLADNIDLSGHYWSPIGTSTSNYFKGTFDGDGHTISNLTIDTNANYVGLFGSTSGAVIKNVTLDNPQVQNSAAGASNTGALVGYMVGNGTVEYCAVTNGSVSSDGQYVGGLIGNILGGTVQYCYNYETTVSSTNDTQTYVNGVAGETRNSSSLCSSFSYVSQQKGLKAANTAQYAAYLSETPTERTGTSGGQHGFTVDQFQDGTVAYFLRTGFYSNVSYEDWGQTLRTDALPKWNGEAVESLKYAHLGSSGTDEVAYAYFNALTQGDNNTYYIENTSDWIAFVKLVKEDKNYSANAVVKEGTVIDFSQFGTLTNKSNYSYLVIADYYSDEPYTGTFIGNGCTVKGVSYSGTMEFALFGTIGEGGSVSGITLVEPKITGTTNGAYNIAGIASHNYGTIENCHVDGGAISTVTTTAAGIAAESFGTVSNCTNSANITAKYEVAGIVATSDSETGHATKDAPMVIEGCSNSGTITATSAGASYAGGIFGGKNMFCSSKYPYGTISKCFNTGNILGQSYIGGIVGYSIKNANASAANVTIENCYNTGAITGATGDANTTGVAGGISAGTNSSVTNCFNMGDVTGTNAQPIVANGYDIQAWSVNSYASCEVNGPTSGYLYYGADNGVHPGPIDEQGRYCLGSGKRTDAEMASGEVAYLLQKGQTDPVWSQQIGVDKHPVLVSSDGPAPVVLITVMLVEDGGTATELTKCYTNAGSTLSAYPKPDDSGAVYTFYEDSDCKTIINTAEKTYDGDTTIYAKVTELTEVDVSGVSVTNKEYNGTQIVSSGTPTAEKDDATISDLQYVYTWYSVSGSSETQLTSAPADASSYKLVVSVDSDTYTGQQEIPFEINQKEITAAVIGSVTKEYDGGTTVPSENNLSIELEGLVDADKDSVTASAESYAYGSAEISSGITITANNVTLSGSRAFNYLLTGTVTGSVGNITAIQIKELTSPTAPVLTEYYSNASEVIAELPKTTTGTTAKGEVTVDITWSFKGTYDSAPGATNSFTWTAAAPENYAFASGVDTTGTITVTNKSADSPTITGTNQAVTYDGNAIDVSTMFSGIPAGSNPTYSIVEGSDTTGEGTLSDTGDLTVTKAGDFKIKVTTQASGNYTAGEATATLTVNKGSFTATVTMSNYAQGGTPSTPSVPGNKSGGTVTYYYNTTDTTGGGTEWTTDIGETLAAGTYYMYAIIAETDLYESCTTSAVPFKVTEASAGMVEPTARDLTYTGKSQELIEPGSIAGGTMVYSLSENGEYSETIPTRINAGTYYVWYKAEGDTQAIDKVSVTIQKAVIVSLNIPETYQLTKPYSSGNDVLDLLQSLYDPAVGTTKDGGEIPVNVPWWGRDIVFDSRPGKTNNFTWSIIITGSYVPQNYTFQADMIGSDGNVSGEIVVYNIPEEGAYTVTLNNVGTGSYGAGSYAAGTEVTIHAGDREGYVFIGWSTEDVVLNDPCSPVTTFTMPDCDVVVEALWYKEEPSHSVTLPTWDVIVEDCSHGTVEPWPEEAKMTTTITVTVTPDKGYELGSLIVTDESGNELELTDKGDGVFTFRMPNSDVTIEAEFAAIQPGYADCPRDETCPIWPFTDASTTAWYHDGVHYCLENGLMNGTVANTFSPNSATSRAMIATILWRLSGSPVVNYCPDCDTVIDSQREAHNWSYDYTPYSSTQHRVDMTCYDCGYDTSDYESHNWGTATYTPSGSSQHLVSKTCRDCGEVSTSYAAHTDSNRDGRCDSCGYSMSVTVTWNASANGGTVNGQSSVTTSVTSGSVASAPSYTPTKTGHTFKGWYTAASGGSLYSSVSVTSARTFYAQFTPAVYTITWNLGDGKTTTTSQTYGTALTLPATPTRAGYTFAGWYTASTGGTQVTSSTTYTTVGSTTYYARWTSNAYTITWNLGDGRTETTSQTYGAKLVLPEDPSRSGYTFAGWYTSSTGGTQVTGNTIYQTQGPSTYYARWEARSYAITWDLGGGKTETTQQTYGEPLTLPSDPVKDEYTFDGWYTAETGGTEVTEDTVYTVDGPSTYYARWTKVQAFSVTVPAVLPLAMGEDGRVHTSEASIINHSTGAVEVTGVTISTDNGWTLVPYATNMAREKVDTHLIGFTLNGAEAKGGAGSESLPLTGDWTIPQDGSLPLRYGAVISALSQPVYAQVLSITFVLEWADSSHN